MNVHKTKIKRLHTNMKTNEGRELHSVYCKALLRLELAKKVQNEITFHKKKIRKSAICYKV